MKESFISIEAIYYLLKNIGKADKLKIVKLIYLADKYHLLHYGRPLTDGNYYAMEFGPVNSMVKDILSFDELNMNSEELEFASRLLKQSELHYFEAQEVDNIKLNYLSETDLEALDYVIKTFGDWKVNRLLKYTHKYPEWEKHEEKLKAGSRREDIKTEELFSKIDSVFGVSDEHMENAKALYIGCLD